MEVKKSTLYFGLIILVLIVGGIFFLRGGSSVTGNVVAQEGGALQEETQKVVLSTKNYNYYPSEIKVKVNQPVSITLDEKVQGCLRSFTIKDLGVSKYARTPQETIDFTPTKKGTFTFACSMGMGYGKLIVE
ncbi:cupredoxin domain-containing protein [Candidatus Pacearchaeota archaeon]|nr:cupredoxin domain-containing protein [Candidatus Pacearchaeota archaeon]